MPTNSGIAPKRPERPCWFSDEVARQRSKSSSWILASVLAAVLGLVFAIIRRVRVPVVAQLTTAFIEFVRSTPIPIQLFFMYYGLPLIPVVGVTLSAMTAGVITLGVHYACYYAEVYRAGIDSVPKGQWEACTALSITPRRQWQGVVLPQRLDHGGDRRFLLADRHVDADDVFLALVDDRVHRDGGLAGAAVADDQLALAAADGRHRVDGLDARL